VLGLAYLMYLIAVVVNFLGCLWWVGGWRCRGWLGV
jgi:hypothetical protein